jgi:predicted AAA+ superfamily ATPase
VINIAGLARDSATARTTIDGYIGILQDTLLATLLPAFEPQLRVRERKHPKLFWSDPGIVRAAKRHRGAVGAEERGALFDGWMLTLLRAHNEAKRFFDEIFSWSLCTKNRCDMVCERPAGVAHTAFFVQSSRSGNSRERQGDELRRVIGGSNRDYDVLLTFV